MIGEGELIWMQVDELPGRPVLRVGADFYVIANAKHHVIEGTRVETGDYTGTLEQKEDWLVLEARLKSTQYIRTFIDADVVDEKDVFLLEPGGASELTCGVGWPD